ncbi:MAG: hypothetical protein P0S95_06935 [Rhabdochlamydiaceae bacterium]|nr:hypothetical protein [Candidatus Amphrikana amoebophyrae]
MKKAITFSILILSVIVISYKIYTTPQNFECKLIRHENELSNLSNHQILYMRDAAKSLLAYQNTKNVITEVQKGAKVIKSYAHYPKGDVLDKATHYQYYYHSHRNKEHGHFHTFYMPSDENENFSHLIAISLDKWGKAIKLFTVNQWVTAEKWRQSEELLPKVQQFKVNKHSYSSINEWINPFFILFEPQISLLISNRDKVISELMLKEPLILKNSHLDEITAMEISFETQISWLKAECAKRQLEW